MASSEILTIQAADLPAVLALNNTFSQETSLLSGVELAALVSGADIAHRIGHVEGLLLAFYATNNYDNDNFRWFSERVNDFVYVDRIVVGQASQGRGLARLLYENLFELAKAAGFSSVVCEVNAVPANPVSDAFHARLNFVEVGKVWKPGGEKQVRYLSRALV